MDDARSGRVLTVPGWWSTVAEAERSTLALVPWADVRTACTHALDGIAVATVELMPGVEPAWGAPGYPPGRLGHTAALAHERRRGGRVFVFEGQRALTGPMRVGDVVQRSAVDAVVLPGAGGQCRADTLVADTSGIRPVLRDGRMVLLVRPGPDGTVEPFERRPAAGVLPRTSRAAG